MDFDNPKVYSDTSIFDGLVNLILITNIIITPKHLNIVIITIIIMRSEVCRVRLVGSRPV